jgi:hypothetical protein
LQLWRSPTFLKGETSCPSSGKLVVLEMPRWEPLSCESKKVSR